MRTPDANKALDHHGCQCVQCRIDRAGLGAGPYTPAEYTLIAPPTVTSANGRRVADDPEFRAALAGVAEVRVAYDTISAVWERCVAERTSAELRGQDGMFIDGNSQPVHRRRDEKRLTALREAEQEAFERRELAWSAVVKAQDKARKVQHEAEWRLVEAERGR